jgi:ABC-type multidrug transport system fused ATPase/permease subunit
MNETGPTVPTAPLLTPAQAAKRAAKKRAQQDFWRAMRFLLPYRAMIALSLAAALFVGLAMAGGFTTMLPVLNVLVHGDTVPDWVYRSVAADRLGVSFAGDGTEAAHLRVVHVEPGSPAAAAGILPGTALADGTAEGEARVLSTLADPAIATVPLAVDGGRAVTVTALPAPRVGGRLPRSLNPLGPGVYLAVVRPILVRFPTGPVGGVAVVLVVGVLISAAGQAARVVQEYFSDKAAILAVNDMRRRLYDHVLHVPVSFFGTNGTSDVTSKLVQDCQNLQDGFTNVLGQSIQMPVNALYSLALALYISWKLTLFIILFGPVMLAVISKFGKKMRRASRRALQRSSSMLGQIEGTLTGIRVVKGANAERFERRRYGRIMSDLVIEQLKMSRIDAISSPIVELMTLVVVCCVVLWATRLIRVTHELNVDKFLLVMACLAMIAESLRRLGKLNTTLQKSGAAASRIFDTLNVPVERPRALATRPGRPTTVLPPVGREIRFENVTFSYPGAAQTAVSDVSLTVTKGESVAVVGRNGSGKTTLLALLTRFYDPNTGRILIDGVDIQHGTLKSLRDQVTIVTQDSVIFPGTVAENIAYGHPLAGVLRDPASPVGQALRAKIEAAARRAFAHDFILEKAGGYDAELGGLGGGLSGGQKQRLNIARAIFRDTPILVLDEATSQVDAESEHLIQQAIEGLMHDRTMFVIAHRLGTIQNADRIVVMERGTVVGVGQHEELLRTCEAYANLYERQLFRRPDDPSAAA